MPLRIRWLGLIFGPLSLSGCGTVCNLMAPPESQIVPPNPGNNFPGSSSPCEPFGGTVRSSAVNLCAIKGDRGAVLWCVSAYALIVDTPVSFVGDALTLPIALARQHNEPLATWWGDQGNKQTRELLRSFKPSEPAEETPTVRLAQPVPQPTISPGKLGFDQ
jgi:uncharacterized protein YceK